MTTEQIINEVLEDWADNEFLANRIDDAIRARFGADSELVQSMRVELIYATVSRAAQVLFFMRDSGRFQDMRLRGTSPAPVEVIEQWIEDVGVEKFIRRHARKYPLPNSTAQLINQIAWAIFSKGNRRRRRWYNKGKARDIYNMYGRLIDRIFDHTAMTVKNGINNVN